MCIHSNEVAGVLNLFVQYPNREPVTLAWQFTEFEIQAYHLARTSWLLAKTAKSDPSPDCWISFWDILTHFFTFGPAKRSKLELFYSNSAWMDVGVCPFSNGSTLTNSWKQLWRADILIDHSIQSIHPTLRPTSPGTKGTSAATVGSGASERAGGLGKGREGRGDDRKSLGKDTRNTES